MEIYYELLKLVSEMESDVNKFYQKGNQAAGIRVRKLLQDVKSLAQDLRKDITDTRKEN